MPLQDKLSTVAFETEGTAGVAETLEAADGTVNIFNAQIIDSTEFAERMGQSSYARIAGSIGARAGQITFQTDLVPGSGAHPAWTELLPMCGWVATGNVYTPRTEPAGANVKTGTFGKWTNGIYEQIHGAMGTFRIAFVSGRPPMIDWTFTGCYTDPTDAAIIVPTYVTTNPVRFVSSALTVGSYTPKIDTLTLDAGNDVALLPDSRSATGYSHANIRDQNVTITMDPERALVASIPWNTDWAARTPRAITWALSEGGIGFSFSAPAAQLAGAPQPGERGGARVDELTFICRRTGNDETTNSQLSMTVDHTP
jgi:hypothetical protein